MTNIDKVSAAISEWTFIVASSILPKINIPRGSTIANVMQGFFGIDPASYNIWKELGFVAEPMIEMFVTPAVNKMLAGFPDERVPEMAEKFVDAFVRQAKEKGTVNVFGFGLGEDAFSDLKIILTSKFEE